MKNGEYFALDEKSAAEYACAKGFFCSHGANVRCKEIGDGNMNYIYRISDGEKSVILKQAGLSTRLSSERSISRKRNRREAAALEAENEILPGCAPKVYLYDETMDCMFMEDLKDYTVLRKALIEEDRIFPDFAEQISSFLAETWVRTSDVGKDHIHKKYQVKRFTNPELCEISERLVFDEAMFNLSGKNSVEPENELFVKTIIYQNETLHQEAGKLKYRYMTEAQALLHGDLHTGSIFVNELGMKIFDSEFAFYGPMGYDIGNLIAHLLLARENARQNQKPAGVIWAENTVSKIPELFVVKGMDHEQVQKDAFEKILNKWYYMGILEDTAGYAGLELIRRVVGSAKAEDIVSLGQGKRAEAERRILEMGIDLVLNRNKFREPGAFKNMFVRSGS